MKISGKGAISQGKNVGLGALQELDALMLAGLEKEVGPEDIAVEIARHTKPVALIIEDHPEMRLFICQSLEEKFCCISAKDGTGGIAKATQESRALFEAMPKRLTYPLSC